MSDERPIMSVYRIAKPLWDAEREMLVGELAAAREEASSWYSAYEQKDAEVERLRGLLEDCDGRNVALTRTVYVTREREERLREALEKVEARVVRQLEDGHWMFADSLDVLRWVRTALDKVVNIP